MRTFTSEGAQMAPSDASPRAGLRRRSRRSKSARPFSLAYGARAGRTPRAPRCHCTRQPQSEALEEPLRGDRVRPGVEDEVIVGEHEHAHDHEEHAGDVEAKEDDEHATQAPDPVAIREQQLAGRAERGAQRDEHQREADDEGDRVQQHAPPGVRAEVGGEVADGHAGDERDVGRKQRQHAGRQEREESRGERDGHAERGAHQRSIAWTRPWAAESSQERGPSATPAIRPCRSITKLEGSARTPYFSATAILGSSATGKLNLRALTNGGTFLGSASSEIATSTKPASLWRRQRRSMAGISSRHGGHHVAQKFTSTTLPRCSESLKPRPSGVGSAKSSATFGLLGLMRSRCLSARSTLGPAAGAAGAGSGWTLGRTVTGAAG